MKKFILGVGAVLGVAVLGILAGAAMQEDQTHIERSITVNATAADLVYFTQDLKGVNAWSPWEGKDPTQEREYTDPSAGVGAVYHWTGNKEVGEGTMTIKSVKEGDEGEVLIDLHFIAPLEADSLVTIGYKPEGDAMKVTWAFDQDNPFMTKVMMVFMDFEEMMGPDFEKGLALLKPLAEKAATDRVAAAETAAEKAAAEKAEADKAAAAAAAAAAPAPTGEAAAGEAAAGEPPS